MVSNLEEYKSVAGDLVNLEILILLKNKQFQDSDLNVLLDVYKTAMGT